MTENVSVLQPLHITNNCRKNFVCLIKSFWAFSWSFYLFLDCNYRHVWSTEGRAGGNRRAKSGHFSDADKWVWSATLVNQYGEMKTIIFSSYRLSGTLIFLQHIWAFTTDWVPRWCSGFTTYMVLYDKFSSPVFLCVSRRAQFIVKDLICRKEFKIPITLSLDKILWILFHHIA